MLISFPCFFLTAQGNEHPVSIGPELQFYPAGMIPGVRWSYYLGEQQQNAITLRTGINLTLRHDWGKHEDERGWGTGISSGYNYHFPIRKGKVLFGARGDIWLMQIHWKKDARKGESHIVILQPTAEAGYSFILKNFHIAPTLAFGRELNIITKGEPVGEGWILLLGVVFQWNFE
ncbi:MAG: hypothetical protein KatS3mg031_1757 [Chitinophagales bacterium]|nr:MAG: hypothetical protein KatS3mg031_1757 [Chitinophagales bacterium]